MKNFLPLAATVLLSTISSASAQSAPDEEQIRNLRAQYNGAIAKHDVSSIVSFLDEDYQVTTSLGDLKQDDRGEEAVSWEALIASREDLLYVRAPESIEVSDDYPLAAEVGTWKGSWSTDDGPVRTGGRYAAMWRKVEGAWKVRSELFVALYCEGSRCP
jgi:ketosteroid isomerase-like protein